MKFLSVATTPYAETLRMVGKGHTVITPSKLAARSLGVPHQSLQHSAMQHWAKMDWAIASPLKSQALFRQVLQ
ncbi:MAG: hypothetical protein VKJ64_16945, partial [Leptolyngbyaceae bacterium]|nr:hypothetical protein [Leptolyngbyaceae bacterium]